MVAHDGAIRRTPIERGVAGVPIEDTPLNVRRIRIGLGVAENPAARIALLGNISTWGHAWRHNVIVIEGVLVPGERHLMKITGAGDAFGLGLGFGQGGQKHSCQDGDDGNDYEKFDQGKSIESMIFH